MTSPFDVLRIEPGADDDEVTRAYRRRVKETHPDRGGSARAFRAVVKAYEELAARGRIAAESPSEDDAVAHVTYLDYAVLDDHGWRVDDPDLFEKAAAADLTPPDYGRFRTEPGATLLQSAECRGFRWPYACRGGACANCAVAVSAGELSLPVNHVLPESMTDCGIRLSCVGSPTTRELQVVFNVKHLPSLDELRLPPGPFGETGSSD